MIVKEIMTQFAQYLSPEHTLKQAAETMSAKDFGFVPIEDNGQLVGVVTDRDITVRAVAKGYHPNETLLKDIMTKGVVSSRENDDIYTAAQLMEKNQIRRLVVLNHLNKMTGIVSLGDIATRCHQGTLSGEIIEKVSENRAEKPTTAQDCYV